MVKKVILSWLFEDMKQMTQQVYEMQIAQNNPWDALRICLYDCVRLSKGTFTLL